jgi:hypothetical protein
VTASASSSLRQICLQIEANHTQKTPGQLLLLLPHPIERRTCKSNQNYDMNIESEDTERTSAGGKSTTTGGKSADPTTT